MKRILLMLSFLLGIAVAAQAQKLVQKNLDLQGKKVELNLSFADSIVIEAWDKNTMDVNVKVDIDKNKYNEYYSLKESNAGNIFKLDEEIDFKAIEAKVGKEGHHEMHIIYKLKVPAKLEFDLKTISGQVILKGALGKMDINSISGFIDYSVPASLKASIDLSTITGNVYSDVKFEEKAAKEISWVGTKRTLTLNGGNLPIAFKTVSGDIYLRKGH